VGYWVLEYTVNGGAFASGLAQAKIKRWEWGAGSSLAKRFPKNATLQFDAKYADRRTVMDFLDNSLGIPIASSRVRALIDELEAPKIEWLPVKVKDHKGNQIPEPYFLLNPVGGQEAIDMKKSEVVMDNMLEGRVSQIDKLVIDPKGIEAGVRVFRLSRQPSVILVDDAVKKAFKKNGITGCRLIKAEGWDGLPGGDEED